MANDKGTYSILVVDNEPKICSLVGVFLKKSPLVEKVAEAYNAVEGLQKMDNQSFDLVICDHDMPGKKGIEFLESLSKMSKYGKVKTLLISGYLKSTDVRHALSIGVENILVKPFTRRQLMEKISSILEVEL